MKEPLRVWLALLQAENSVVSSVERDLEQRRIPLPWYEVLVCLARAPGGRLRMQEIASQIFLSGSGATRVVDKMEQAALLRRESAPEDQRGRTCELTESGRALLASVQPEFFKSLDRCIGARLSRTEQQTLTALLGKLA